MREEEPGPAVEKQRATICLLPPGFKPTQDRPKIVQEGHRLPDDIAQDGTKPSQAEEKTIVEIPC